MEINVHDLFHEKIDRIFKKADYQNIPLIERGFYLHNKLRTDSILFIGLNPSFKVSDEYFNEVRYYNLDQADNKYKTYFGKFEKINKDLIQNGFSLGWTHFDLLFFRETEQKYIDELLKTQEGVGFIYDQLMVSKEILELLKPKLIVVVNTKARLFLGKEKTPAGEKAWMDYSFGDIDEGIGVHRVQNKDSKLIGTPIFFSSMLSGQRAIDVGSFERLKWHIKFVLKKDRRDL